jgi:hypothetical protein
MPEPIHEARHTHGRGEGADGRLQEADGRRSER